MRSDITTGGERDRKREYYVAPKESEAAQTPYDALAFCAPAEFTIRVPQGNVRACLTSPNVNYVPWFQQFTGTLRCRDDGRYGIDDPMCWPQIFCGEFTFICCIQRIPESDKTKDRYYLHWTLTDSQFTSERQGGKDGGRVHQSILARLEKLEDEMNRRMQKYDHVQETIPHFALHYNCLRVVVSIMRISYGRLAGCSQPFHETRRTIADFQRSWLMAEAWFRYVRLLNLYLYSRTDKAASVDTRYMGLFTADLRVLEQATRMGIPVWYLRQYPLDLSTRVVNSVPWTMPDRVIWKDADPPFPYIGHGSRGLAMLRRLFACLNMPRELANQPHLQRQLMDMHLVTTADQPISIGLVRPPNAWDWEEVQCGIAMLERSRKMTEEHEKLLDSLNLRPAPPKSQPPGHEFYSFDDVQPTSMVNPLTNDVELANQFDNDNTDTTFEYAMDLDGAQPGPSSSSGALVLSAAASTPPTPLPHSLSMPMLLTPSATIRRQLSPEVSLRSSVGRMPAPSNRLSPCKI